MLVVALGIWMALRRLERLAPPELIALPVVALGAIAPPMLLVMNLVQYRQLTVAQDTIELLGKHVAELKK